MGFKIINASGEVEPKRVFKLSQSPNIQKMSECEGVTFTVSDWIIYEEEDKKDNSKVNTILSIGDTNGVVRATNSSTFTDMFTTICTIMGSNAGFNIQVVGGESKNGRHFITCDLV